MYWSNILNQHFMYATGCSHDEIINDTKHALVGFQLSGLYYRCINKPVNNINTTIFHNHNTNIGH